VTSKAVQHHEFGTSHAEIEQSSDRSFGFVFTGFFALVAAYQLWQGRAWWPILLVLSGGFLVVALWRPALLAPLNRGWAKVGLLLGAIVAPIVMGIVYFAVITPMGLLARLAGKDFLRLRRDPAASTYWLPRSQRETTAETLRDQF
jgi:hypothetical protein